jgi:hypothetical protein
MFTRRSPESSDCVSALDYRQHTGRPPPAPYAASSDTAAPNAAELVAGEARSPGPIPRLVGRHLAFRVIRKPGVVHQVIEELEARRRGSMCNPSQSHNYDAAHPHTLTAAGTVCEVIARAAGQSSGEIIELTARGRLVGWDCRAGAVHREGRLGRQVCLGAKPVEPGSPDERPLELEPRPEAKDRLGARSRQSPTASPDCSRSTNLSGARCTGSGASRQGRGARVSGSRRSSVPHRAIATPRRPPRPAREVPETEAAFQRTPCWHRVGSGPPRARR